MLNFVRKNFFINTYKKIKNYSFYKAKINLFTKIIYKGRMLDLTNNRFMVITFGPNQDRPREGVEEKE